MKKIITTLTLLFCVATTQAEIKKIGIEIWQTLGADAIYDASERSSTWSGGAAGWILTDEGSFHFLDSALNIDINATINGAVDTSHDGIASAVFSSANWRITLNADGFTNPVADIAGHLDNVYNEVEMSTDKLEGRAVVTIESVTFNNDYWDDILDGSVIWNGGNKAGIIADITLPNGTGYTNFAQDYTSHNMILTLFADETQIPEPATITMLALGALSLIRRK